MYAKDGHAGYSIDEAAELIGTTPRVLAVWEQRFGFPCPTHLPWGWLIYPPEQVEELSSVVEHARRGGMIAPMLIDLKSRCPDVMADHGS